MCICVFIESLVSEHHLKQTSKGAHTCDHTVFKVNCDLQVLPIVNAHQRVHQRCWWLVITDDEHFAEHYFL